LNQSAQNISFDKTLRYWLSNDFNRATIRADLETNVHYKPKADIPIIEWLEENLILPDSFPIPGPFRIRNSPHLEEPLRKALDPEVRSITLMGCSQFGKTLYFICVWAYKAVNDPAPSLYANPTDAGVKSFALQKLEPVINSTPILKKIIAKKRRGNTDESSTRFKIFLAGWTELISLQSPGKTRQRSVRDIYNDDTDEIKITLKSEGSPHSNLKTRTTVYKDRAKEFNGSTPRKESSSFIELKFKEGSQAHRNVVCPKCKKQQVLDEDNIEWEKEKTDLMGTEFDNHFETAKAKCIGCGHLFSESERMEMLAKAKWIHKYPNRRENLSYHLGKASSTLASLSGIAELRVTAEKASENGDDSLYESYVNNEKGLPYKKIIATEIDAKILIDRREDYIDPEKKNIIPNGVLILTAFVDAQAGSQTKPARFEGEVWGWGVGEECWIVDRFKIEGSPEDRNTREKLKNFLLQLEYIRKDGLKLHIKRVGFDSGWASQSIYELVERMGHKGWYATKGANRYGAPLLPRKVSLVNNEKSILLAIGSQAAKSILYERLGTVIEPGPKRIHHTKLFCDVEYFDQLTANYAIQKTINLLQVIIYDKKKHGLADEAADLWLGAYAMMKSLNVNWRKYKAFVDEKVGALSNQEETTGEVLAANSVLSRMKPAAPLELTKIKNKNKNVVRRPGVNPITNYG
jgi:phage terminase large subunit GpA-like protein